MGGKDPQGADGEPVPLADCAAMARRIRALLRHLARPRGEAWSALAVYVATGCLNVLHGAPGGGFRLAEPARIRGLLGLDAASLDVVLDRLAAEGRLIRRADGVAVADPGQWLAVAGSLGMLLAGVPEIPALAAGPGLRAAMTQTQPEDARGRAA